MIQDADAKIKMKKCKFVEHETNLDKEEKVLEGNRDSLKGTYVLLSSHPWLTPLTAWITRQNASLL